LAQKHADRDLSKRRRAVAGRAEERSKTASPQEQVEEEQRNGERENREVGAPEHTGDLGDRRLARDFRDAHHDDRRHRAAKRGT
jgi:hypothetical protein